MTQAAQLTLADTAVHNLYALILADDGVTQLPQRTDLGAIIFLDPSASVTFTLPLSQAGNSGNSLSLQDQEGNELTSLLPGIPFTLGLSTGPNEIALQAIKVKASASGVVLDVASTVN